MNTDHAWERWGRSDPYYGVLSVEEFRGVHRNAAPGFFESGEAFISGRLEIARAAFGEMSYRRALDFGCGVGRLLIPLSGRFEQAVGVDVSEAMLAECRANLDDRHISNALLVRSDDQISQATGSFDFINSFIVLQHIPVKRGYGIIDRLLSLLADGGVIALQFTVDRGDTPVQSMIYWARRFVPGVQILTNLAKGRALTEPLVEMNEYDLGRVVDMFKAHGLGTPILDWETQGRVKSVRIMARQDSTPSA